MIELINITKIYGKGAEKIIALDDIDFTAENGKFYAILGKSGSGKSTMLNIIGALDRPTSGDLFINGNDIAAYKEKDLAIYRNSMIGFVFQSFYLEPTYTVEDNIALPLLINDVKKKERRQRVEEVLEKIGITDLIDKKTSDISGGQKQRVALARALVTNPSIILADEPTGNLDNISGTEVIQILRQLADEGKTVIMVTHNRADAEKADVIKTLVDGKLKDKENIE